MESDQLSLETMREKPRLWLRCMGMAWRCQLISTDASEFAGGLVIVQVLTDGFKGVEINQLICKSLVRLQLSRCPISHSVASSLAAWIQLTGGRIHPIPPTNTNPSKWGEEWSVQALPGLILAPVLGTYRWQSFNFEHCSYSCTASCPWMAISYAKTRSLTIFITS